MRGSQAALRLEQPLTPALSPQGRGSRKKKNVHPRRRVPSLDPRLRGDTGFGLKRPNTESYHPGEGRGPIGKVGVTEDCASLATLPNWAPAFVGVDGRTIVLLPNQKAAVALVSPIIAARTKGIGGPP